MISIIIPCYNTLHFLEKNLDNILEFATFCCGEIIIIDDGSEQNIQEYIYGKKSELIVYYRQSNKGVASARNKGIFLASNDYILFLDSDDYLDFDVLKKYLHEILKYDFTYWGAQKIYPEGTVKKYPTLFKNTHYDLINSLLKREQQIFMGGFCISREIAKSILFDVRFKYGEDLKFIFESILKAKTIFMIDSILLHYVQHSESAINTFNDRRFDSLHAIAAIDFSTQKYNFNDSIQYLLKRDRVVILRTLSTSKSLFEIIEYLQNNHDMARMIEQHFGTSYVAKYKMGLYIVLYKIYVKMRNIFNAIKG
ncbi:TPA: glycosyltransferase family 2 protein [Escherichia albertii]